MGGPFNNYIYGGTTATRIIIIHKDGTVEYQGSLSNVGGGSGTSGYSGGQVRDLVNITSITVEEYEE